jgi:hypothetical protein
MCDAMHCPLHGQTCNYCLNNEGSEPDMVWLEQNRIRQKSDIFSAWREVLLAGTTN